MLQVNKADAAQMRTLLSDKATIQQLGNKANRGYLEALIEGVNKHINELSRKVEKEISTGRQVPFDWNEKLNQMKKVKIRKILEFS